MRATMDSVVGLLLTIVGFGTFGWFLGRSSLSTERKDAENITESQKIENISDKFFSSLAELSQDATKQGEYSKAIDRLSAVVIAEAKKNSQSMTYFFDEIIPIAAEHGGPGFALQVEGYADTLVREEIERLRKESSVAALLEKDKTIHDLKKANLELQKKVEESQSLQGELDKLKYTEYGKLRQVLIRSSYYTYRNVKIDFVDPSSKKAWKFLFPTIISGNTTTVSVPPGKYEVSIYDHVHMDRDKECRVLNDFEVTVDPTCVYEGYRYHGLITLD